MKSKKISPGFTLAELLVSVGIIVLFSAVMLPSLGRFGRRNELTQAAHLVQAKILETKSLALAPRSTGGDNVVVTDDELSKVVQYELWAPQLSFAARNNTCRRDQSQFTLVEVLRSDLGNRTNNNPYGEVILCETLTNSIAFVGPQQRISFSVTNQGGVVEPIPPASITWTVRHPRLTEDNCRDIVIQKATGQVTISSAYDPC